MFLNFNATAPATTGKFLFSTFASDLLQLQFWVSLLPPPIPFELLSVSARLLCPEAGLSDS